MSLFLGAALYAVSARVFMYAALTPMPEKQESELLILSGLCLITGVMVVL